MTPASQRKVLEAFNTAARFKVLHARLTMMLEEITGLIDHGNCDGLQEKARVAIPVWTAWRKCLHDCGASQLRSDPKALETDALLKAAAAGCKPSEILRQVMLLREENGWDHGADAAESVFPGWTN